LVLNFMFMLFFDFKILGIKKTRWIQRAFTYFVLQNDRSYQQNPIRD